MRGREAGLGVLRGSDAGKGDCGMLYRRLKTEIDGCIGTLAAQRRILRVDALLIVRGKNHYVI
jgi:hypothetical protein